MPDEVLWSRTNVSEAQIPARRAMCEGPGGTLKVDQTGPDTYNIFCLVPQVSEAPASVLVQPLTAQTAATDVAPQAPAPVAASSINVMKRDIERSKLHPVVRRAVEAIEARLADENIPMRVFEAYRAPERQAHLFAQGRTRSGGRVTNADAWDSMHQYGLAADFVRFENGKWNWNDSTPQEEADWNRFHAIALENGLEPLSWERPHVQMQRVSLTALRNGDFPSDGDEDWSSNLAEVIERYPRDAPQPPSDSQRPAMPAPAILSAGGASAGLNWRSMFGGDAWAYDEHGVYTRDHTGALKTWRTAGAPLTVQEVIAQHGDAIRTASAKHGVRAELLVMTIATEAGRYRLQGFTGPDTFRWERLYKVNGAGHRGVGEPQRGDYSAGPMQVVADTACWINRVRNLGYDNARDFPFFDNKPNPIPIQLGLYSSEICIDVGAAYIKYQMAKTGGDPLLVAAAYNAGSLKPSSENHWRIHCHGNHIDRAAEWYGDACFVLNG